MKAGQTAAAVDTVLATSLFYGAEATQLAPNIEVTGGTVNIYGSQANPETPPSAMTLTSAGFAGITTFGVIPNYMYFETASGTPVVILTGVKAATPLV